MALKTIILTLFVFSITLSCKAQNNKSNTQSSIRKNTAIKLASTDSTNQLMNENEFWNLIDKSRAAAKNNYQTEIICLKKIC